MGNLTFVFYDFRLKTLFIFEIQYQNMKFSLFYIFSTLLGLAFLFIDFFNQFILLKIFGLFFVMFSVYKLQSNIPSKSLKDEPSFVEQEKED